MKHTLTDIEKHIRSLSIGIDNNIGIEGYKVHISMRNTVSDEPDEKTYEVARSVVKSLNSMFPEGISIETDIIDEWIDIFVELK